MTDIDTGVDIVIRHVYDAQRDHHHDYLVIGIPLNEHVTPNLLPLYQQRALAKGITAHAEDRPDQTWIIVHIPKAIEPARIRGILDDARALAAEAPAAATEKPQMAQAESVVRAWWSEQAG
jgi:hypothetical protein